MSNSSKHTDAVDDAIDSLVVMSIITPATARLMKAAPDMLEALETLEQFTGCLWDDPQWLDPDDAAKITAAIAKAKGKN